MYGERREPKVTGKPPAGRLPCKKVKKRAEAIALQLLARIKSTSSTGCELITNLASGNFPQGNHQQLLDSITKKLWPLGKDITFVPGHGPTSTFGHEMLTNPFVGGRYG